MGFAQHFLRRVKTLLLILMILVIAQSAKPLPKCQPKLYYKIHPLVPNQYAILNLDNMFDGYNLNFTLKGQEQWSKYINITEKFRLQKKQIPDTPLVGLISYHLEKVGNSWGTSFVSMSQRGDRFYLSYGFLSANTSAPVINNDFKVTGPDGLTCFDAVVFPKEDVIIVDCAVKRNQPDQQGFLYYNQFHYFRISNGTNITVIKNPMYVPFQKITRRKLQIYTQKISGNTYLLRSYMFDGVDQKNQNNTYVDVFFMTKPLDPWVVSIIDRTFLRTSTLRAVDIRVYLSQIYVLDYTKGLHRIRINTEEDLIYSGFYEAKGFTKFNVYSNNLDDKFELALANDHQIQEIDWSNVEDPILLTKYSIMPQSEVKQIFINERFVVISSISDYNQSDSASTTYRYTWIFTRGDRTYTKAFKVIKHDTNNTFVDLNTDQSYLMVMDDEKIANYAIDQAILTLSLKKDEDFLDRLMNFTIIGKSIQPTTNQTFNCSFQFNFTLVQQNNRTMWATGVLPPAYYNANYPGKVVIPLYQYALGPNITYRITEVVKNTLKKYKIYQQDQLRITWQKQSPLKDVRFLRTQTVNHANQDLLMIYTQDLSNKTYVTTCKPNHHEIDVHCTDSQELQMEGQINNWATSRFYSQYTLRMHHIVAFTTTRHYNEIWVSDVSQKQTLIKLPQGKGFEGNVTHVQTFGKYMYVIKRYVKTILIYDMQLVVDGMDDAICSITHDMMYKLGVKYFSPQLVQASQFYPNVLFIKTSDTIIVLDMNRQCVPKLLSVLRPVESTLIQFNFMVTLSHLIVTIVPNTIIQYDLQRIYIKDIKLSKKYPMYGYKLPKNYDTDVSEYGNCMFITTINQGGDYQIFIYRGGFPAVASLYDVIDLYTYEPILVDASGSFIDYVTVYSGQELRIFRQYEIPIAQIYNPEKSYQFWIEYYNTPVKTNLQLISVSVINLPTKISLNPKLNDIMNTKDLLYSGDNRISEINDTDWYEGNVLTIKADCKDCQDKVIVKNHIHYQNKIELMPGLVDYDWTYTGGSFQAYDSILQVTHHGRVRDFVHMPQVSKSVCLSLTAPYHSRFQVSACMEGQGVNLYLTSQISHKAFTFSPYSSKAKQLLKIEAANQLIMLVETSSNPFFKGATGGVFIYAFNFDLDQDQAFEEIQYIDFTDFTNSDKPEYVVNADLSYHPETNTYRLYLTQITKGIYQIAFKYNNNVRGITILQVNYINMPSQLAKLNMTPPYDATYQAVKVVQTQYNPSLLQSKDVVILTTGTYHTFMIEVVHSYNHLIVRQQIKKVFLRYAYYVVQNTIRYVNGLIVLRQTLPDQFDTGDKLKSKQLLTIYDIRGMPLNKTNSTPALGLIGAYMIMDTQQRTYDFNLTYNTSDPHQQPRVNMVVVHQFSNQVDQLSLHRNLSVFTKQTVDTQIIYLDLINDFDIKKIRILLNGWAPYPEWKLITIILFSIIGFFMLLGASFVAFKKIKAYRAQFRPQEERQSLVTQQKSTQRDRNSLVQKQNRYSSSQRENKYQSSYKQRNYSSSERDNRFSSSYKDKNYSSTQDKYSPLYKNTQKQSRNRYNQRDNQRISSSYDRGNRYTDKYSNMYQDKQDKQSISYYS